MRLNAGDEADTGLANALQHEFLRCQDAFKDFERCATFMIHSSAARPLDYEVQSADRLLAYHTYNAYSRFVHHLYEFLIGAAMRDTRDTRNFEAHDAERHISANLQRILTRARKAIQTGTAPTWENHISYYPEKVPPSFAKEFRQYRNKIAGHVSHERTGLSLSAFYERNHKYLYMLYSDCLSFWRLRDDNFPNLKEITEFSVLLRKTPPVSS